VLQQVTNSYQVIPTFIYIDMKVVILTFIILSYHNLAAQDYSVSFGTGVATYSMISLKNYENSLLENYFNGLRPTVTDNFPPYIFYQAELSYWEKKTIYGLVIGHGSTGRRTMYKDYSGMITRDNLVRYNYIGIRLGEEFVSKKNLFISANFNASAVFNSLKIKERLEIFGDAIENSSGFHSVNFALRPYFCVSYRINQLSVAMDFGYEYQIAGRLFYNELEDVYLIDSNNNEVIIDGRGFRGLLTFGYKFKAR